MRKRRFEAAFIVTVGAGIVGAAVVQAQLPANPPPMRPPTAILRRGHVLVRDAAGVCRLTDLNACPPNERDRGRCTPPPPTIVECPPVLSVPGRLEVIGDGECRVMYTPNCRPHATCNPPAPRTVQCP
jgi:hypothetical protein